MKMGNCGAILNYPIKLIYILNHLSHLCLRQIVLNLLRKFVLSLDIRVRSGNLQFYST